MAVKIKLTKGYEALVDDEDVGLIKQYKWFAAISGIKAYAKTYFGTGKKRVQVKMENLVLGYKKGLIIDHVNSNGLDNRRENLRFATYSQNNLNRKKSTKNGIPYKGVKYIRNRGRYIARLYVKGKEYRSRQTKNIHLAALWYNIFVLQYSEGFGVLNDVPPHACLD